MRILMKSSPVVVLFLLLSALSWGQTPNPPTNVSSFAINANVLSAPQGTVAADLGAAFGVSTNLLLRGDTFTFPSLSGIYVGGGPQYVLPTCKLLAATNLNCTKFQFYVNASGGVARGPAGINHGAGMAGFGLNYDPANTGKFTLNLIDFHVGRLPGLNRGVAVTAAVGAQLGFGTNLAATQQKRLAMLKREAKLRAKLAKQAAAEQKARQ